jgi:hypothetical protein
MHVACVAVAAVDVHSHLYNIGLLLDFMPHFRITSSERLSSLQL